MTNKKTITGTTDTDVLAFTVGKDPEIDGVLAVHDCVGTAAHVTMLSRLPIKPKLLTTKERKQVIAELRNIIAQADSGSFKITARDEDVHMAVERAVTRKLGDLGKKIHTGRSRNDQVALDLRLFARDELLAPIEEVTQVETALLKLARKHEKTPMVGRTHMQPAMPSSVGLWASAYAESLLDDTVLLINAYEFNDQCPLGAAASYGVPLPIDREMTSRLLGFSRPSHNVLHAINARGKCESVILFAMAQVMLTLSRLAADLILFSMPEFGYFDLPAEYCTGSSIMPQKKNPDVLELIRAKAATVLSYASAVSETMRGLPGGYNRDMQETKAPFVDGIATTRASLRCAAKLITGVAVNKPALKKAFTPEVFAADEALRLVAEGMSFRDAYDHVKNNLSELGENCPSEAIAAKTHLGAPAGLDLAMLSNRARTATAFCREERKIYSRAVSRLLTA
jgi:argininosuccinate lyase